MYKQTKDFACCKNNYFIHQLTINIFLKLNVTSFKMILTKNETYLIFFMNVFIKLNFSKLPQLSIVT